MVCRRAVDMPRLTNRPEEEDVHPRRRVSRVADLSEPDPEWTGAAEQTQRGKKLAIRPLRRQARS
jgi:hypothetical protein